MKKAKTTPASKVKKKSDPECPSDSDDAEPPPIVKGRKMFAEARAMFADLPLKDFGPDNMAFHCDSVTVVEAYQGDIGPDTKDHPPPYSIVAPPPLPMSKAKAARHSNEPLEIEDMSDEDDIDAPQVFHHRPQPSRSVFKAARGMFENIPMTYPDSTDDSFLFKRNDALSGTCLSVPSEQSREQAQDAAIDMKQDVTESGSVQEPNDDTDLTKEQEGTRHEENSDSAKELKQEHPATGNEHTHDTVTEVKPECADNGPEQNRDTAIICDTNASQGGSAIGTIDNNFVETIYIKPVQLPFE